MKIHVHLGFNGQCKAAFEYYEKNLGGKIQFVMTYGESPMADKMPEMRDAIMHATLAIGDTVLMGADSPPDRYEQPKGLWVSLGVAEPAEAERLFTVLKEGGTVTMPLQETFWAQRFGMVVDRFGTPWMVNCSIPQ
jgi:PhnB protein